MRFLPFVEPFWPEPRDGSVQTFRRRLREESD